MNNSSKLSVTLSLMKTSSILFQFVYVSIIGTAHSSNFKSHLVSAREYIFGFFTRGDIDFVALALRFVQER